MPSPITAIHDRPLAAAGLVSYRCRSPYGWIMIGARDDDDAMREAARSTKAPSRNGLQRWDGAAYQPVDTPGEEGRLPDAV